MSPDALAYIEGLVAGTIVWTFDALWPGKSDRAGRHLGLGFATGVFASLAVTYLLFEDLLGLKNAQVGWGRMVGALIGAVVGNIIGRLARRKPARD